MAQLPDKDQTSYSRKQMLAKIAVCMAGRLSEEMIFGKDEVITGKNDDNNMQKIMIIMPIIPHFHSHKQILNLCPFLSFSQVTSGGSSDLKQASNLAVEMVSRWGMSDELGPQYIQKKGEVWYCCCSWCFVFVFIFWFCFCCIFH